MSFPNLLFLAVRVLHVLLAAAWLGSTALMVMFVFPSIRDTGPSAGPLASAIARRGLNAYMGVVGGLAVVTGFYLYWRVTGHFDPALSATRSAMVFGTGGICGLVAIILGGAVVGRNARKMGELGGKAMALPEGPERASLMKASNAALGRTLGAARIVLLLQVIALACMAIGHYV
jgi:hypothetical protein